MIALPQTNISAPEGGWLEDEALSFWEFAYFQGANLLLVLGRVDTFKKSRPRFETYSYLFTNHPLKKSPIFKFPAWIIPTKFCPRNGLEAFRRARSKFFDSFEMRIEFLGSDRVGYRVSKKPVGQKVDSRYVELRAKRKQNITKTYHSYSLFLQSDGFMDKICFVSLVVSSLRSYGYIWYIYIYVCV